MDEIELKILEINIKQIDKKILALGGVKKGKFFVKSESYDFSNKLIKEKNELLRLRQVGDKVELTYKQHGRKEGKFKVCNELEINPSNFKKTKEILNALDLKTQNYWEKYRTSYVLGNVKLEIDELPGIPPFLELEGDKCDIEKTVKLLGFSMKDTTNYAFKKVLKKYNKDIHNLKF
ncbi:MAG: class IV adenylate cyclase [Candidatus Woesearchaeota archaeon]|jgi:adenylate cyclase class 2